MKYLVALCISVAMVLAITSLATTNQAFAQNDNDAARPHISEAGVQRISEAREYDISFRRNYTSPPSSWPVPRTQITAKNRSWLSEISVQMDSSQG